MLAVTIFLQPHHDNRLLVRIQNDNTIDEYKPSQGHHMTATGPYFDEIHRLDSLDSMLPGSAPYMPSNNGQSELEAFLPYFMAIGGELAWSSQYLFGGPFDCLPNSYDNHDNQAIGIDSNGDHVPEIEHNKLVEYHGTAINPIEKPQSPTSRSISTRCSDEGQSQTFVPKPPRCAGQGTRSRHGSHPTASDDKPKRPANKSASLERNRISALKSRKRSKEWEHKLEAKSGVLAAKHRTLTAEYGKLLRETLELKNDLISHARCHDENVNAWIESEAQQYAQQLSDTEQEAIHEGTCSSNNDGIRNAFVSPS